MACTSLLPCVVSGGMEERWRDGGEENPVEDEFACAGALRGALLSLHPNVERVFGVTMEIGAEEDPGMPHSGQIWLKLRGRRKDVTASKLFVRGVVNQEEQQEVPYPGVLHCVFCGARGLFLDSLMKNTSAHLVVGSPGFLLISGLTEPVVKAYSLITDLVERYEATQGRRADGGERGSGESLDSRRAFKSLVEIWEDRHTLDLLVLPGAVKETLLDLVRESGLGADPVVVEPPEEERAVLRDTEHPRGLWETQEAFRFRNHLDQRPLPLGGDPRTPELSTRLRLPESSERDVGNASRPSPFSSGAGGGEGGGEGATVGLGGDGPPLDRLFRSFALREREEEEEEEGGGGRRMRSPQELGEEEHRSDEEEVVEEEGERLMSAGSRKELGLLLKFFTTMGYAERVVRRVVCRTGPREASEILDLVQQEQDRSETEHQEDRGRGGGEGGGRRGAEGEAGSLLETEEVGGRRRRGDRAGREPNVGEVVPLEGPQGRGEEGGDDFVLGVLTKAAVSCGYREEKVVQVYGSLPELSTHQLLLQLQRGGARETEAGGTAERGREGPREVDESVLEVQQPGDSRKGRVGEVEGNRAGETAGETADLSASSGAGEGGLRRNVSRQAYVEGGGGRGLSATVSLTQPDQTQQNVLNRLRLSPPPPDWSPLTTLPPHPNQDPPPFHNSPKMVRGPPQSAYPPTLLFPPASPPKHGPQLTYPLPQPPQPPYLPPQPTGPLPPIQTPNFSTISHPTVRDRRGLPAIPSGAVVTGEQRFLEGLQTTFDLRLTGDPGDPGLRMIIIDGSNVAMSHGLGKFFSCRGIALAVQHFWNRGHRQITTFVPQWRSKRDPRIKEQHYLTELQNLGLLSYTPSREVQGKRINSYDDRFMLQLAHKTEGVIVTNDNLRDLLDESHVWTDIIKKRLLQYTFVGDHFMVPDDPLGRGGPHLDHFLHSQHSIPTPGSHSFAGSASSPPRPSRHPRSHSEGLQFRDRTSGVPTGLDFSFGPGQGRRGGQDRGQGPREERSPADTARLRESLSQVFPDQDSRVTLVLQSNPTLTDINSLSYLILEQEEELE